MSEPRERDGDAPEDPPAFGPGGYVPPKAAKRARKIVLREPMGLGWPIAAVVAGALLVLLGVVFVLTRTGPPGGPFQPVIPLADVDPHAATTIPADGQTVLIVRAGGPIRVFAAPPGGAGYCAASRRLESDTGNVWALDGRHLGGPGASLVPLPSQVHDGIVYVNLKRPLTPPPATGLGTAPTC